MIMRCPLCGRKMIDNYNCEWCGMDIDDMIYGEYIKENTICPNCGEELMGTYCESCGFDGSDGYKGQYIRINDDDEDYDEYDDDEDYDDEDIDFDDIDEDDEVCLNCTYWGVDSRGAAYGVHCQKGYGRTDPDDTCDEFIESHHFANYGDNGQYQFNKTQRMRKNLFDYWEDSL